MDKGWSLFVVAFFIIAIWLGAVRASAGASGWSGLAKRYRATVPPDGKSFSREVVRFGGVPEGGVTDMVVSPAGLYLEPMPLFRLGRPPLMIPWSSITTMGERKAFLMKRYELGLAGITSIWVKKRAYEAIRSFLPPGSGVA